MKFKRTMVMVLGLLVLSMSLLTVEASERVTAVPALISTQENLTSEDSITESEAVPELFNEVADHSLFEGMEVVFEGSIVELDVQPHIVNNKVMVPLRGIAEALDYEVQWHSETRSVDLINGAQFTSIIIDKNRYFRNKMTPSELSAAPIIIDNRTLVPVECITEILGYGVAYTDNRLKIYNESFTTLTGYISIIEVLEGYTKVYVAPRIGEGIEMWEQTVLIVSEATMNNYGPFVEGDFIHGVHLPAMTMSIPGQTSAVILF